MRRAALARRRSASDWRLFTEAAATIVICRLSLRRRDFTKTGAWAVRPTRRVGAAPVERLVWAVEAAARRLGGVTCLCKALALQRMMTRAGHVSELRIGVDKSGGALLAHAWLVHDGAALVGGPEAAGYTVLAAWRSDRSEDEWRFS
ncbi:lasso peptide biosynthesis B2 protein [Methylocystis sp. IM3]|uniref:lasso peptide biosynthesis B2 protein n=1 Tax=unclassified Methylocystis TaxID=2625913 RepID=UPI0031194E34